MTEQQVKETISAKETIRQARMQKLTELADRGINPYPYVFDKNANAVDLQTKYKDLLKILRNVTCLCHLINFFFSISNTSSHIWMKC